MWTLRDLWMMLNPDYAQKYRENKAMDYGNRTYGRDDSNPGTLSDYFRQKIPDPGHNPIRTLNDYVNDSFMVPDRRRRLNEEGYGYL
jgi:hypothetical protein